MEGLRPETTAKAIIVVVFTSILFRCVCGANLTVGGASGWDFTSDIESWSSSTTFSVGDDLVFSYTPVHDVVEVNKIGYDLCTIMSPIATYNTGETVIPLTKEGTRYFVCGRMGHCQQGLKLEVQVSAQSKNNGTDDDPNQKGGRKPPPKNRSPPSPPSPRHGNHPPGPPSPDGEAPWEAEAEAPCDCSRAEDERNGMVPLITLVIILALARTDPFLAVFISLGFYLMR